MKDIQLNDYEIIFDDSLESVKDFLSAANYSSVFILVDENTKQHCLPVLGKVISSYTVIETKSGETNKNLRRPLIRIIRFKFISPIIINIEIEIRVQK